MLIFTDLLQAWHCCSCVFRDGAKSSFNVASTDAVPGGGAKLSACFDGAWITKYRRESSFFIEQPVTGNVDPFTENQEVKEKRLIPCTKMATVQKIAQKNKNKKFKFFFFSFLVCGQAGVACSWERRDLRSSFTPKSLGVGAFSLTAPAGAPTARQLVGTTSSCQRSSVTRDGRRDT